MSKHTPGPWRYANTPYVDGVPYCSITGGNAWSYDNSTMGFKISGIMREDDARLIAAAPDMLAVLQELVEYTGGADHALDDKYIVERVHAAIAKATTPMTTPDAFSPTTPTKKTPPGTVGIFTDKLGRVVETIADFDTERPGGFSLAEAQKWRVQTRLVRAVVRAYCSEMILEAMETHDCKKIVERLVKAGATVTIIPIGHEDE